MNDVDRAVQAISAAAARPLRAAVLRPGEAPETLVYPGDEARDSLHAGAFVDGTLVGIVSVARRPPPETLRTAPALYTHPAGWSAGAATTQSEFAGEMPSWQLRGMATLPQVRGQGHGAALVRAVAGHVAVHGGGLLWCNARTTATGFYAAMGFAVHGDVFESAGIGPHIVMWRLVAASEA